MWFKGWPEKEQLGKDDDGYNSEIKNHQEIKF